MGLIESGVFKLEDRKRNSKASAHVKTNLFTKRLIG